ncbi:MAG: SUMF1/EgtB/PvdO family nonheme iron enzyme [Anaerolineae bacterium]|nr:SUMF1/EgtB/PvdO family nonheme iron enzyme [Anaerolineae bacterium]
MRATMTPQTAITDGLSRPSECDVALVIFWGRIGTPLPVPEYQKPDGTPYLSGTEWEFWDALHAERDHKKPITLLYRRVEKPSIDLDDDARVAQYQLVKSFFKQFEDSRGALTVGVNTYTTPEEFGKKLERHLRKVISEILDRENAAGMIAAPVRPLVEAPPLWTGSPFPGLRAFSEADAPIFFGRGAETSELVKRVEASRFTAVVAASGSGKSSLVAAGLIPRLKANAIVSGETGSKDWRFVRLTPGQAESPFLGLYAALRAAFPEYRVPPEDAPRRKKAFVETLMSDPAGFVDMCGELLHEAKAPAWAEVLFFVDQFEELFTLIPDERADQRTAFVALLKAIHASRRLRCVVTMRSDFYAKCLELPILAALLKEATYPLAAPTAGALIEMIKRPAERAGLTWDDGLPERIQADTGSDAGALALMAYALDELYQTSHADKCLTFDAYKSIGAVEGAIGKRAETAFAKLTLPDKDRLLQRVFRELVTVDERATATRQRTALGKFDADERALIRAFADARLLITNAVGTTPASSAAKPDNAGIVPAEMAYVEVAHEAIFRSWDWLRNWIAEAQEDLILLRQVRAAAAEWVRHAKDDSFRLPAERLKPVYEMIERQQPALSDTERDFIEPEQDRLLRELETLPRDDSSHERRRDIGDRLAVIGDTRPGVGVKDGVPELLWLPVVPGGDITIEKRKFTVQPFYIAQYQITYAQFQTFLDALDGFDDARWWEGMPDQYKKQEMNQQRTKITNAPRDSVSWYQSVAFARWLNHRLRGLTLVGTTPASSAAKPDNAGIVPTTMSVGENAEIRLPTEWEWQWMAQGGMQARAYPWGDWKAGYANTSEAGLSRTTAVGMYPHGEADCGALDVAGNLWEWCLNDYSNPQIFDGYNNSEFKVLRGSSLFFDQVRAAASFRSNSFPGSGGSFCGVRMVVSSPMRL